jgi:hypothetical protein
MSTTVAFALRAVLIAVLVLTATLLTAAQGVAQDPGYYDECVICQLGPGGDPPLAAGYPVEPPAGNVDATQPGEPTPPPPGGVDPNAAIGDQIQTEVVYLAIDSDSDAILDGDEITLYGTDPYKYDTDFDGISDYGELFAYYTNPLAWDSDGDGWGDGDELFMGYYDPLDPNSHP